MENPYRNCILRIFDQLSKDVNYIYLGIDFKPLARKELLKGLRAMSENDALKMIKIVDDNIKEVLKIA